MNYYVFLVIWLIRFICVDCERSEILRVGNPDKTEIIERPCPTYDLNCIRNFFEKHAHCKRMFGPIPDPLYRPEGNFYIPRVNISMIVRNQRINNLKEGRVEEFYINRDTDNLVIALHFKDMTQSTERRQTVFKYQRRGKEPVVTDAFTFVKYNDLVITAVIPKIDDLQLKDAECTTYSNGADELIVGPSASESTDPQVPVAFAALLANVSNNIQEIFLTDSAYFINVFIQYNICDFGLLLT